MTPIENPAENPCFGCGPRHPRGLQLSFAREGDDIICSYLPKPDEIGWPGLMHTGLHFTTLFETSYWAALELTGQVHVADGPQTFDQKRLPRVGVPFVARARIISREPLRIAAESATPEGKPLARLETGWRPGSRAATERAGIKLPEYLLADMTP